MMRFAAASRFSAGDYASAATAGARAVAQTFDAARKNAPDWTGLARTSMNTRSKERQTAMKAEADVATAGMKAFGNVKGTQIKGAYELEAFKTKLGSQKSRMAGRLGALGGFKMPKKSNSDKYDKLIEKYKSQKQDVPETSEFSYPEFDGQGAGSGQPGALPEVPQLTVDGTAGTQQPPTNPSSTAVVDTAQPSAPATPQPAAGSSGPVNPGRQQAYNQILNIAQANPNIKFPHAVAAQSMHETGFLSNTGVYKATGYTNPFGQTGDRGWGTIPREGFKDGWTLYPDMTTAVNDHAKLWHDTANHSQNYNAHASIRDGIAAVAPAYSPDADPANIRKGFTVDAYSKNMTKILRDYGGIQL